MTYRDQLEFKIRKLTRAIEAIGDLPNGRIHLASSVAASELLTMLKADRSELRRIIATGRRSCGECGNPMSQTTRHDDRLDDWTRGRLARLGASSFHACDNEHCEDHGRMVFE